MEIAVQYTVQPRPTATLLIWSPCYYTHFILVQTEVQSVIILFKEPLKYIPLLILLDLCGLLVTRLTGFHCSI